MPTNENTNKKMNLTDALALGGHAMILLGGVLISASQLLAFANAGRISDFKSQGPRFDSSTCQSEPITASQYFRRG
jgi:hypothetical protein